MRDDVVPLDKLSGAWWWSMVPAHGTRFAKSFRERVPDGHVRILSYQAIPEKLRRQHECVLRRASRDRGIEQEPTVCGAAHYGGEVYAVVGHRGVMRSGDGG